MKSTRGATLLAVEAYNKPAPTGQEPPRHIGGGLVYQQKGEKPLPWKEAVDETWQGLIP